MFSRTDTIVALATAPAPAGIGVVRLSGERAHAIARALLSLRHDLEPRHATLTRVVAGTRDKARGTALREAAGGAADADDSLAGAVAAAGGPRAIDEVVATFFPAPHSYTAEDVVEISAHGSLELLRAIVKAAMDAGARLAEPGEFTLRAFLNGRLDLMQAEAVADLVNAVTPLQARVAFDQLEGTLTRAIGALDAELFDLAAALEASVDFPDEGYHFAGPGEVEASLERVRDGIDRVLATASRGRLIREGRHIAILGKPNVGKSSLFNTLVGTDRAIVAARPGTTRDLLRETIDFEGIRLGLVDTAGIRATEDEVEREGVARARGAGGVADLVLVMLDRSRALGDEDRALLEETSPLRRVVIVNKCDLETAWDPGTVLGGPGRAEPAGEPGRAEPASGLGPTEPRQSQGPVLVSLKTGAGMGELRRAMREALDLGGPGLGADAPGREDPAVTNLRHVTLLEEARASIERAIEGLRAAGASMSEEFVVADIAGARRALEEMTGRRASEDLLRHIFGKFCIGK